MMKTRKPMAALLAALTLSCAGTAMPAPAAKTSAPPRYVFFTLYRNLISRLSPQPELLETPIDLELRQVPLGEALRAIFAQAGQAYTIEGPWPEEKRITLHGKGMPLFEALDQCVHQADGGWMQAMEAGKPAIRIGHEGAYMTGHLGPLVLPRDQAFLDQVDALRRARPPREPTEKEIRQMSLPQAAASGRGRNLLGRRGIPSLTIP